MPFIYLGYQTLEELKEKILVRQEHDKVFVFNACNRRQVMAGIFRYEFATTISVRDRYGDAVHYCTIQTGAEESMRGASTETRDKVQRSIDRIEKWLEDSGLVIFHANIDRPRDLQETIGGAAFLSKEQE